MPTYKTTAGDSITFQTGVSTHDVVHGATSLSTSGGERETIDGTRLLSTGPEAYAGATSTRTATIESLYDPNDATMESIRQAYKTNAAAKTWRYKFANTSPAKRMECTAQVSGFVVNTSTNSMVTCTITLTLSTDWDVVNDI